MIIDPDAVPGPVIAALFGVVATTLKRANSRWKCQRPEVGVGYASIEIRGPLIAANLRHDDRWMVLRVRDNSKVTGTYYSSCQVAIGGGGLTADLSDPTLLQQIEQWLADMGCLPK